MLPREVRQWARVLAASNLKVDGRPQGCGSAFSPGPSSWASTTSAPPLVPKHGSRLVKTTGDSVLLEFPHAHSENTARLPTPSVVDAVKWTVAVQVVVAERNTGVPENRR